MASRASPPDGAVFLHLYSDHVYLPVCKKYVRDYRGQGNRQAWHGSSRRLDCRRIDRSFRVRVHFRLQARRGQGYDGRRARLRGRRHRHRGRSPRNGGVGTVADADADAGAAIGCDRGSAGRPPAASRTTDPASADLHACRSTCWSACRTASGIVRCLPAAARQAGDSADAVGDADADATGPLAGYRRNGPVRGTGRLLVRRAGDQRKSPCGAGFSAFRTTVAGRDLAAVRSGHAQCAGVDEDTADDDPPAALDVPALLVRCQA